MTFEELLDKMAELGKRAHARTCVFLADSRLVCDCGAALTNARVDGCRINLSKMYAEAANPPKRVPVTEAVATVAIAGTIAPIPAPVPPAPVPEPAPETVPVPVAAIEPPAPTQGNAPAQRTAQRQAAKAA